jgi:hypothetical protein
MRALTNGTSWAGLFSGPAAWAISTQGNYSLVPLECEQRISAIPYTALALAVLALAGGLLSWRARKTGGAAFKEEREASTERFVASISMMAACLFAAVILLQGGAALILDGCIR